MMQSNPTATARNTYFHRHARGFWNECDIVRCQDAEDQAMAKARGFERISRRELARHIRDINTTALHIDASRVFDQADPNYAVDYLYPSR